MALPILNVQSRLKQAPKSPGVYLFRNAREQVIYVGKAKSLVDRLTSYFVSPSPKALAITSAASDLEWIIAATELEALAMEADLIRHYRPRFNVRLLSPGDLVYLKIDPRREFPPIEVTRKFEASPVRLFGPYLSGFQVKEVLRILKRILPYRTCKDRQLASNRACSNYALGYCAGPCGGHMTIAQYDERLEQISNFLSGKTSLIAKQLTLEMQEASNKMFYEKAARLRDQIKSLETLSARKALIGGADEDRLGMAVSNDRAAATLVRVRSGRVLGEESHFVECSPQDDPSDVLAGFIIDYYGRRPQIPSRLVLPWMASDSLLLGQHLSLQAKHGVTLHVPSRGGLRKFVDNLTRSAADRLALDSVDRASRSLKQDATLALLAENLNLPGPPRRIECYDISNLQGVHPVASMTVAIDGHLANAQYRRFNMQGFNDQQDDFGMHAQALRRRLSRLLSPLETDSFSSRPDLIVIDGGRGQLSATMAVLEELNLAIPICALAKEFEEIYLPHDPYPLVLERTSPALHLLQALRDEAHRFAITAHRKKREKAALSSPLDSITGLGPRRKRLLLTRFGSLKAIKQATLEELQDSGIPLLVARRLLELL